ncbi:MAG: SIR2 family NAD-dependent protein deacylase [Candidatus Cryptobacteroides sp.]
MTKKKITVLTGAGVSAESGISTFRDSDGLWENHRVEDVATIEGWYRNPSLVLDFYNERRRQLPHVRPNAAHEAIAALEKDYDVTVVTQNVDNLHERAGSTRIIHLHGELTKVRPEDRYNERDGFSEETVFDIGYEDVHLGDLAPDGAQLRPHIVWFGEAVPKIEQAIDAVEAADILLIVGTSLQVYPAAGLYAYAKASTPIYIIDPKDVPVRDGRITHIKDVATRGMEIFRGMIDEKILKSK